MIVTPGQLNRRAALYHQLGSMISAGVPLIQAMEMAGNTSSLRSSRKTILALIGHLKQGLTFSDSMVQIHGWMPEFDVALLSAGEHAGRLDTAFKTLSLHYEMRAQIIRDTLADLFQTILTLHVYLLVFPLPYLVAFVLGIFDNQFRNCVPFIIDKSIKFGGIYFIVFFLIFACQGQRGEGWRAFVESIGRLIPVFRTAQKYLTLSRISSALEALISSGVSVVKAWELSAVAGGSPRLKKDILKWKTELEQGATPAELVSRTDYFPVMFANLYNTGEMSGRLDETLERLRDYYREEGFRTLRNFTRTVAIILYFLMAIRVAISVISFYTGYFNSAVNMFDN